MCVIFPVIWSFDPFPLWMARLVLLSVASRDASKRLRVLMSRVRPTQDERVPRPSVLPRAVAGFSPLRSMSQGLRVTDRDRVGTCPGAGQDQQNDYLGSIHEKGQRSGCSTHPTWFNQANKPGDLLVGALRRQRFRC